MIIRRNNVRDVVDAVTSPTTATNTSIIGLHREARGHGMRCLVVLSPELYTSAYRTPNKHEKKQKKATCSVGIMCFHAVLYYFHAYSVYDKLMYVMWVNHPPFCLVKLIFPQFCSGAAVLCP